MFGTPFRKHPPEQRLAEQVQAGDSAAARQLYEAHARYLSALCARYVPSDDDVCDVLQETFLRAFSSIGSFTYRGEGSLRAWLARIALNESLKWLRASSRLAFCDIEEETLRLHDEPETEGIPDDVLHEAIRALPDGYRAVFNLYVIDGKSHKEIAAALGIKPDTSASQLHKAKALLATRLNQYKRENA